MKVGYVRVSKEEQHKDLQVNALKAAGCERIYEDTKSGAVFVREGLDECLTYLRAGDVLTVWKLDRLGRSVADLIRIVNELEVLGIDFCWPRCNGWPCRASLSQKRKDTNLWKISVACYHFCLSRVRSAVNGLACGRLL